MGSLVYRLLRAVLIRKPAVDYFKKAGATKLNFYEPPSLAPGHIPRTRNARRRDRGSMLCPGRRLIGSADLARGLILRRYITLERRDQDALRAAQIQLVTLYVARPSRIHNLS